MNDDVITLTAVEGWGHHGVLPEERRDGQRFITDVELHLDTARAVENDDLNATVDYSTVAAEVVSVVEGEPCQLIETVAERIAQRLLGSQSITWVRVTVHKPEAPVGVTFGDVSVTVVRGR
jgi:dihydroneopterin aldolase